jgi:ketosteroid isomerase-like protein
MVEAEKPVLLKNVAPYEGRGRASGATGYRRENGRVVASFPVFGRMFYAAQRERSARGGGESMKRTVVAAVDDVDELIEQYYRAQREFLIGNPEPVKDLFSQRDDVTLANPYGPPVRGFDEVAKTIEHVSSLHSDGEFVEWQILAKYVSAELAYVVQIERAEAKIGPREDIAPLAVRATMLFRPEEVGEWKIVHRHADPITTPQPAESVIQE